jgi:hypothetical protein|tara:strand:+ start:40 stop:528 length:489 start_codon:yes stop_codon:yes gene_type:complete
LNPVAAIIVEDCNLSTTILKRLVLDRDALRCKPPIFFANTLTVEKSCRYATGIDRFLTGFRRWMRIWLQEQFCLARTICRDREPTKFAQIDVVNLPKAQYIPLERQRFALIFYENTRHFYIYKRLLKARITLAHFTIVLLLPLVYSCNPLHKCKSNGSLKDD